ncbi:hypothetical protein ACFV80_02950 [Streptomyces sp. NPDC059862]
MPEERAVGYALAVACSHEAAVDTGKFHHTDVKCPAIGASPSHVAAQSS